MSAPLPRRIPWGTLILLMFTALIGSAIWSIVSHAQFAGRPVLEALLSKRAFVSALMMSRPLRIAAVVLPWLGLAGGLSLLGAPRRDPEPASPSPWPILTLLPVVAVGAAWMSAMRAARGIRGGEYDVLPTPDMSFLQLYTIDLGLPSLIHTFPLAIFRLVGGLTALTAFHAGLYALLLAITWRCVRAASDAAVALAVVVVLGSRLALLDQMMEVRAYATYLTLVAIGGAAMLGPRERRRDALVFGALGAASLDALVPAVLLGGYAIGRAVEERSLDLRAVIGGRAETLVDRLARATLLLGISLVPLALAAAGFPRGADGGESTRTWMGLQLTVPALLFPALLGTVAGLRREQDRPAAIAAITSVLVAIIGWKIGIFGEMSKYYLFLSPLAPAFAAAFAWRLSRRLPIVGTSVVPASAVALLAITLRAEGAFGTPVGDAASTTALAPGAVVALLSGLAALLALGGARPWARAALSTLLVATSLAFAGHAFRDLFRQVDAVQRTNDTFRAVHRRLEADGLGPLPVHCARPVCYAAVAANSRMLEDGWSSVEVQSVFDAASSYDLGYTRGCPWERPHLYLEQRGPPERPPTCEGCTAVVTETISHQSELVLWRCDPPG